MTDGAAAFEALGDATRRQVLQLLRSGERSVAELTEALPVTQSAVSQHLRVLRDAGLVADRASGTRRYYRVTPDGFAAVRATQTTPNPPWRHRGPAPRPRHRGEPAALAEAGRVRADRLVDLLCRLDAEQSDTARMTHH